MPPITCIYLGACIDNESKNAIINIANKRNIPVKQMQLDRVTYDLHAEDITNKYNTVIFWVTELGISVSEFITLVKEDS